ncbi:MAG: hypothetical protein NTZ94_09165 [Verrucomicrobia bacterium]|nr:hypothetical protein [Verrucomicrobiota bacterium]
MAQSSSTSRDSSSIQPKSERLPSSNFSNWKNPGIRQLLQEYKIECEMKGHALWKDKSEFLEAAQQAKVETLTPEADKSISFRSRTQKRDRLLELIKCYQSYPRFRNEKTLNAIYEGFRTNAPMDRPIVLDFDNGER